MHVVVASERAARFLSVHFPNSNAPAQRAWHGRDGVRRGQAIRNFYVWLRLQYAGKKKRVEFCARGENSDGQNGVSRLVVVCHRALRSLPLFSERCHIPTWSKLSFVIFILKNGSFELQLILRGFRFKKELLCKIFCSQLQCVVIRAIQRPLRNSCSATHSRPLNCPGDDALTVTKIAMFYCLFRICSINNVKVANHYQIITLLGSESSLLIIYNNLSVNPYFSFKLFQFYLLLILSKNM